MQNTIEERKILEAEFHDRLRDPALRNDPELYSKLTSNKKWYTVARQSKEFTESYLRAHSPGARALDFACGDGQYSFLMAEAGAEVTGIDISPTSIENATHEAAHRRLNVNFEVMDCEQMSFPDQSFDLINVNGVLHHMDLSHAYRELARVLKPTGSILCVEAIAHNPVFHAYRKLTPHLRTEFEAEHILRRKDVLAARRYFKRVEWRFFHCASLAAVPFRRSNLFNPVLSALERVDSVLLSIPPVRWWAWQVAFTLSQPRQSA
jgi:2-polyprenyl-3-methyl-5-hydroxy-6-metoxy-1,4-benzoquinol methylase